MEDRAKINLYYNNSGGWSKLEDGKIDRKSFYHAEEILDAIRILFRQHVSCKKTTIYSFPSCVHKACAVNDMRIYSESILTIRSMTGKLEDLVSSYSGGFTVYISTSPALPNYCPDREFRRDYLCEIKNCEEEKSAWILFKGSHRYATLYNYKS